MHTYISYILYSIYVIGKEEIDGVNHFSYIGLVQSCFCTSKYLVTLSKIDWLLLQKPGYYFGSV